MTDTDDEDGLDPDVLEEVVGTVERVAVIFGEITVRWKKSNGIQF